MGFALSGVATGMDTSAIVSQLMYLEAAPQRQLQTKSADTGQKITALQGMNSRLSSVIDSAKKIAEADTLQNTKASASSESVSVTSSKTAEPASLRFTVDKLATGQTSAITHEGVTFPLTPPNLSITVGTEIVNLSPQSGTMEEVAKAINDAKELGLSAVMVKVGAGDQYILQVTGKPGADNAFNIAQVDADGNELAVLASADTANVKAQDAQITLTDLGTSVTSKSNTFEGLMPGVDVTVSKVTKVDEEPVTVSVKEDTSEPAKTAKAMVDALNVVFNEIGSRTKSTTTTEGGRSVVKPGILGGDATTRALQSALANAASYPITLEGEAHAKSPAEYGIELQRDGTFKFDEAKFAEALKKDPNGTNEFMTKLASRVEETAKAYGDPKEGIFAQRIKTEEFNRKGIEDQIANWDTRLDRRQSMLQAQFAAMEKAIAGMNSQQQWLAGQLAGLPSWNQGG